MHILIFYFVTVFVSGQHGSAGAAFENKTEACNFGATFAAKHGGKNPHWDVLKVTIDIADELYLVDNVNCGNPS